MAVDHAIDHVAHGAAQDQRQRQAEARLAGRATQHPDDDHRRRAAQAGEEPALPAFLGRQETERRASVVDQREVEERQQMQPFAVLERGVEIDLGELVQDDDEQRQRQPAADPRRCGADGWSGVRGRRGRPCSGLAAGFTRAEQVGHATAADLGWSASWPTSRRQCQQRSHFLCWDGVTSMRVSPSPACTVARDTISTKRRSSPRLASSSWSALAAYRSTSACSDEPMSPAVRTSSSLRCTSARIARRRVHGRQASASA